MMQNAIGTFMREAQGLTKNPLGIIALFISFIYALACAVLGFSGSGISTEQKWPIVWLIVLFPVCVLLAFVYLVVKHHSKLYAPSDYRTDEGFLKALSPIEQKDKLDEDVREITAEINDAVGVNSCAATSGSQTSAEIEVVPKENSVDYQNQSLRQTYILAEDLVLRELEAEFRTIIQRNVRFQAERSINFDGAMILRSQLTVIEIKYAREGVLSAGALSSIAKIAEKASILFSRFPPQTMGQILENCKLLDIGIKNFRMIVAIAYEGDRQERLREQIDKLALKNPFVEWRLYNFGDLKKKYGADLSV